MGDQVAWFPDWSPDRTTILFDFTDDNGDEQIATIRPDGTQFEQLTDGPGYSEAADYSPDGTTIVFDRSPVHDEDDPAFTTSLWTMGVDGGDAHQVALGDGGGFDYEPEFSPDGRRIAFARYDAESDSSAAFVAKADGTAVTQLTPFVHFTEHPRWSPDGAMIIYNIEDQRNRVIRSTASGSLRHRAAHRGSCCRRARHCTGSSPTTRPTARESCSDASRRPPGRTTCA